LQLTGITGNQEDSIIVCQSAIDAGLFVATSYKTITDQEVKHNTYVCEKIELPDTTVRKKHLNYNLLDHMGVVKKGSHIQKGDVIIGKITTRSPKNEKTTISDSSTYIKKGDEGIVDRIIYTTTSDGYKIVKIVVRCRKIPEVGDKLASNNGQKGTIGMILPREDMPFTQAGMIPDIIINPHSQPSRMTINMLLAIVLGKSCVVEGVFGDATPFSTSSVGIAETLCDRLKTNGYSSTGNEMMFNGMTGEPFDAMIFVGPTYYQRLKHLVSEKIHARNEGVVTTTTRQPTEGRSRDGGLRFGEMERDAMISHGASRCLKDRLFEQSDPFQIQICSVCKNMAASKSECSACNTNDVNTVDFPYASKLLIQLLNVMGIKTSFYTE
jgi:DNA-directed RNA polymerase II subunit RPB2